MKYFAYGDNVNTDVIIPARYLNDCSETNLKAHCMEDIDPKFAAAVLPGDILFAGNNFGCGSSREHAPLALKAAGIAAVVAASFARIFFRNALNTGLLVIECPDAATAAIAKHDLHLDLENCVVRDDTSMKEYPFKQFSDFERKLIAAGGLLNLEV